MGNMVLWSRGAYCLDHLPANHGSHLYWDNRVYFWDNPRDYLLQKSKGRQIKKV